MPSADYYYRIDETTPKNPFLLEKVKLVGSLRKLAKKIEVNPSLLSLSLNKKKISLKAMIKIAKYFNKDTREIWP